MLIFAAAKIYGRKVDFLEQEILGVAKNFEQVELANANGGDEQQQKEKENSSNLKKTRTKKYAIKDSVNLDKIIFEEKPIVVVTKNDINKTLATPSKLTRLQKMREFFAKNKARSGKLAIPKSMMLLNEEAVSNFGQTLIHDYDDHKDIVGSRRDFTSHSFYINSSTGELQNDLNFTSKQSSARSDYILSDNQNVMTNVVSSNDCNTTDINSYSNNNDDDDHHHDDLLELMPPLTPHTPTPSINLIESGKNSPSDLMLNIDEGIGLDELDRMNFLPIQPTIKLNDIMRASPYLFPENLQMNDSIDMMTFSRSILTVIDRLKEVNDFVLPPIFKTEVQEIRMKNIFMVPIKRLKHKCLFDLPDNEFKELKRRKIEQYKSTSNAIETPQNRRMFKLFDLYMQNAIDSNELNDDDIPFRGFTKAEQNESPFTTTYNSNNNTNNNSKIISTNPPLSHNTEFLLPTNITDNSSINDSGLSMLRKASNDSGFESEGLINSSNENSSIDDMRRLDSSSSSAENDTSREESSLNNTNNNNNSSDQLNCADSCIGSSLASGNSGDNNISTDLPSFFDEFNVQNSTANDESELELSKENQSLLESEERIQQMRQSAMNVSDTIISLFAHLYF